MAARKKTKTKAKPHYVRSKKRKGAESAVKVRRFTTIALLVVVAAGVFYSIYKGFEWIRDGFFSKNPRFEMHHLVISCDGNLGEDKIREYSGLREGMNLFELSFEEIEEKLNGVSLIESVYLERKLPNTLIVEVKERVPVAKITGSRATKYPFLVDRYGFVLPHRRSLAKTLPLIKGLDAEVPLGEQLTQKDVEIALKIIALCDSNSKLKTYLRLEVIDLQYQDYIYLYLNDGMRAKIPRYSLEPRLHKLASTIQVATARGQKVKTADVTLDSPNVPITTY
jgi:cell division septal protein FtsQ